MYLTGNLFYSKTNIYVLICNHIYSTLYNLQSDIEKYLVVKAVKKNVYKKKLTFPNIKQFTL